MLSTDKTYACWSHKPDFLKSTHQSKKHILCHSILKCSWDLILLTNKPLDWGWSSIFGVGLMLQSLFTDDNVCLRQYLKLHHRWSTNSYCCGQRLTRCNKLRRQLLLNFLLPQIYPTTICLSNYDYQPPLSLWSAECSFAAYRLLGRMSAWIGLHWLQMIFIDIHTEYIWNSSLA